MAGIETGTSFRRLVAKTLAQQFGKAVEAVCAPFQFAVSTRAGTDTPPERRWMQTPECPVLFVDGVVACDHVMAEQFPLQVAQCPQSPRIAALRESIYARTTTYLWEDGAGVRHRIHQAEGGEQGDPLMPLLLSLGIHDSLCEVRNRMRPEDTLFAYLDDVYVSSPPIRTRDGTISMQKQLLAGAGIQLHTGKTRVWNRAGTCSSTRVEDLGEGVWSPDGIKILGTPIGSPEFVHSFMERRLEDEGRLWEVVTWVPDLQSVCQIFPAVCWGHVATTCFAHCPQVSPRSTRCATMTACGRPWVRFWEDSLAGRKIS